MTFSMVAPEASRTALQFSRDLRVCSSIVAGNAPVAMSMGSWPDVMIRLPARMPCEYGPIAAGAFSVAITFFNSGFHLLGVRIVYHRRKTLSI